jgi:hypothetical protein
MGGEGRKGRQDTWLTLNQRKCCRKWGRSKPLSAKDKLALYQIKQSQNPNVVHTEINQEWKITRMENKYTMG